MSAYTQEGLLERMQQEAPMTARSIETQQQEMRHAFVGGAPGILVSGLVWIAAAVVCAQRGIGSAVWTLLIGGALIHPFSIVLTKAIGRPAKTPPGNALNALAMSSTVWLIFSCAMAFGLYLLQPNLFFPAMMLTIGSRYMIFATVYGRPLFWALGASLIAAANLAFFSGAPETIAAGIGGLIEIAFAIVVFTRASKHA
jgi:hypothetical protein